jgi:peptidyl-tRNA hydrolase, PTH1 family
VVRMTATGGSMIAGLGNPGPRYENTPHNAGFLVVDELAARLGARWRSAARLNAKTAGGTIGDTRVCLLQPQTFMNESGLAVAAAAAYWKIAPERILVVLDDADLDMGRLRFRGGGGTGGHRGLDSVIRHLGVPSFARLRIGVGRGGSREESLVRHVLSAFSAPERAWMRAVVEKAADAAIFFLSHGLHSAMNDFNGVVIAKEETASDKSRAAFSI